MKQYLELCRHILEVGTPKTDRTNTGTISTFGYQMRFNLNDGFPLVTTKSVYFKAVLGELLWFLTGDTNIQTLVKQKIRIWNEWPYEKFKASDEYKQETIEQFVDKIINDDDFAKRFGDLGPVYGYQWRNFNGVDQINGLVNGLKNNPMSRRHIVSAWNPKDIDKMALPPCHAFMQFYVDGTGKKLSLQMYQRSADVFLGVPFNIASYSALLMMVAQVVGLQAHEFVITFGDVHIYNDHLEQIKTQLTREPRSLPTLKINPAIKSIFDFKMSDFELVDYNPHPQIKGKVSV
jgi:thymidylate synthase